MILDFYFYGDTNYIEEMFDLSCVDTVISDREEAFKFGFFINRLPDIDDIVTIKTADYEFDPEYDFIGERFIFIVSNDKIGIKEVLKKAQSVVESSPFFPTDWKPDGLKRYIPAYIMCFNTIKECVMFMDFIINCLNGNGFFKLDMDIIENEFFSTADEVKYIKKCEAGGIERVEGLHGTISVFHCNSKIDGLEYMYNRTDNMYKNLLKISDSKSHFIQMFYIDGDTYLMYWYWE